MKPIYYLIIVVLLGLFTLNGCEVSMPMIATTYPLGKDIKDVTSIIAMVLQERNFVVTVINPEMGLVVTDWNTISTSTETILFGLKSRMRLSITVDKNKQEILIKPSNQCLNKSIGWTETRLNDKQTLLLDNIVSDITIRCGGAKSSIRWIQQQI
jgi:hypothetical protein